MRPTLHVQHLLHAVLALTGAFVIGVPYAAHADERYEGVAYALDGGQVLYRETHWRYTQGGTMRRLVLYRCAHGEAFARKHVIDSPSATAPDFDFLDARDGYEEGVFSRKGQRVVYTRKDRSAARKETVVPVGANSVIDAGFDAMVRLHWEDISSGRPIKAPFLLPSRAEFLSFKIEQRDNADTSQVRQLRMALDTWYGFAVPALELRYSVAGRRLLRFQGIATIRDRAGRYQNVRIEFPPDQIVHTISAQELQTAEIEPLVHECRGDTP